MKLESYLRIGVGKRKVQWQIGTIIVLFAILQLLDLMKEVHHLRTNPDVQHLLPNESKELYEKQEVYRQYRINLGITIDWYNQIRKNSQKVEFDLVEDEIKAIDERIEMAQNELNWNSKGKTKYILVIENSNTRYLYMFNYV